MSMIYNVLKIVFGWDGLLTRAARSLTFGLGAGFIFDMIMRLFIADYPLFMVSIFITIFGVWGFYFDPADMFFSGPYSKRKPKNNSDLVKGRA